MAARGLKPGWRDARGRRAAVSGLGERFPRRRATRLLIAGAILLVATGAKNARELKYDWRPGQPYAYSYSITLEGGGESLACTGKCVYVADPGPAPPPETPAAGPVKGNGTGFVVSPDGYLLTCAHVVKEASKLEVVLEEKKYDCKVVSVDEEHDLAIVKIEAANLPCMPLADSDKVELNQDVLVIGFPLSNTVGDSVKMSRGIIAGVIAAQENKHEKLLQVDAAINPGNSGGPVVNEMGQVVGVAAAKLTGESVSNVGFVVPANDAAKLLRSEHVKFQSANGGKELKGVELGKKAQPCVAFIGVTIDPNAGLAERRLMRFRTTSQLSTKSAPPIATTDEGRFIATPRGEVSDYVGQQDLPLATGKIGDLLIEPLTGGGKKQWQTSRAITVSQVVETPAAQSQQVQPGRSSMRRSPGLRGSTGPSRLGHHSSLRGFGAMRHGAQPAANRTVITHLAVERTSYEIVGVSGDVVTIKKHYELVTAPQAGKPSFMTMDGKGTIEFDQAAGVPKSMTFDLTLQVNLDGRSEKAPIKISYERIDPGSLPLPGTAVASLASSVPTPRSASRPTPRPTSNANPVARANPAAQTNSARAGAARPSVPFTPPIEKVAPPGAGAIKESLALVEELYRKDLESGTTTAKKLDLAERLIDQARVEKQDMSARFALLEKARRLAVDAGELDLALEAVDAIVERYEMDGLSLKNETIAALASSAASADQAKALAIAALSVFDEALLDDEYNMAKRLGGMALAAARKSGDDKLVERIKGRGQRFKSQQEGYAAVQSAEEKLKADPRDSEANLLVGRFHCFCKGDWEVGLEYLVQGADAAQQALAQKELQQPAAVDEQLALADGWHEQAEKQTDLAKERLLAHASQWYQRALPGLSGLSRIKAEKRIVGASDTGDDVLADPKLALAHLLQRARRQVKQQSFQKTAEVGFVLGKKEFQSVPEAGALLIGFEYTHNGMVIEALRPLYLTEKGQVKGPLYGVARRPTTRIVAKKGYAVGAAQVRAGLGIDGFSLTFMEIADRGLNPAKSYASEWIGGQGGRETKLDGAGGPILGIFGHGTDAQVSAFGLICGAAK